MQDIAEHTGGELKMGSRAHYTGTIQRLMDQGLVREVEIAAAADGSATNGRRHYRLTACRAAGAASRGAAAGAPGQRGPRRKPRVRCEGLTVDSAAAQRAPLLRSSAALPGRVPAVVYAADIGLPMSSTDMARRVTRQEQCVRDFSYCAATADLPITLCQGSACRQSGPQWAWPSRLRRPQLLWGGTVWMLALEWPDGPARSFTLSASWRCSLGILGRRSLRGRRAGSTAARRSA